MYSTVYDRECNTKQIQQFILYRIRNYERNSVFSIWMSSSYMSTIGQFQDGYLVCFWFYLVVLFWRNIIHKWHIGTVGKLQKRHTKSISFVAHSLCSTHALFLSFPPSWHLNIIEPKASNRTETRQKQHSLLSSSLDVNEMVMLIGQTQDHFKETWNRTWWCAEGNIANQHFGGNSTGSCCCCCCCCFPYKSHGYIIDGHWRSLKSSHFTLLKYHIKSFDVREQRREGGKGGKF